MKTVDHKLIYEDTTSMMRSFREDMFRNINFVGGIQYTDEDIRYLDAQRRPHYHINLTRPEVMAFIGAEESNRIMTRAEPVESSDAGMAEMLNALLDQDNIETNAYHQISIAARDAAICRFGVVALTWERTRRYPEGQYILRVLDPRDFWWDYHPSEFDFENSEYLIHSRWYSPEHLIQLFVSDPTRRADLTAAASRHVGHDIKKTPYAARLTSSNSLISLREKSKTLSNANHQQYRYSDYYDRGLFRVIEMHDRRVVVKKIIMDFKNNDVVEIPDEMKNDREFIQAQLQLRGLGGDENAVIPMEIFEYWQSVSAPDLDQVELLFEKKYPVQDGGYSYKVLPFYNFDHDRLGLKSLVDDIIDPQEIYNKSVSSELLLMNRALNPTIIIGPGAIDDEVQKAALKSNRTGVMIEANDPGQIHYKYPEMGIVNLFARKANDSMGQISKTSTINEALKGIRPSDASGTLVTRLSAFSESMHRIVWQNITNFILSIERKHLALDQYHLRMPRIVRELSPNGTWNEVGVVNKFDEMSNAFLNDPGVGKWDIKLDKTKYTQNDKQQKLDRIAQYLAQTDPETKMGLEPLILSLLDIPGTEEIIANQKVRQTLLLHKNQISLIELKKQLQELLIQEGMLPDMAEVQKGQLEVQKLNNTAQGIQLQTAIQQMIAQIQGMSPPEMPPNQQPSM